MQAVGLAKHQRLLGQLSVSLYAINTLSHAAADCARAHPERVKLPLARGALTTTLTTKEHQSSIQELLQQAREHFRHDRRHIFPGSGAGVRGRDRCPPIAPGRGAPLRHRHVGGAAYSDLLLTLADVIALVCRVDIDVLTMHSSHAVAHALPPRSASENGDLQPYEG